MMLHLNFFSYNCWVSKEIDKQAPGFCSEFVERMNRKNWGKKEGNDSRVRDSLRKIWARFDLGNSLEWWFREGAPEGILGRPKNSMSVLIGKTKIKRCRALKRKEILQCSSVSNFPEPEANLSSFDKTNVQKPLTESSILDLQECLIKQTLSRHSKLCLC